MNKYFIGVICGLIATPLYASLGTKGIYVGLSGTATEWDFETENDASISFISPINPPITGAGSVSYDDQIWDYSIEARGGGYFLWGQDRFLTAIEIFGGPHNHANVNHDNPLFPFFDPNTPVNDEMGIAQLTEARYSYGVELKQNYFFIENLSGFLLVGGLITTYNITTNLYHNNSQGQSDTSQAFTSQFEVAHIAGWRVGGGLEKFWDNQLSATLQVTYTGYEDFETTAQTILIDKFATYPTIDTKDNITFNPSAVQVSLGLNYYFSI